MSQSVHSSCLVAKIKLELIHKGYDKIVEVKFQENSIRVTALGLTVPKLNIHSNLTRNINYQRDPYEVFSPELMKEIDNFIVYGKIPQGN